MNFLQVKRIFRLPMGPGIGAVLLASAYLLASASYAERDNVADTESQNAEIQPIDFDRQIRPLLANTCYVCHGPDEAHREADLRLDVEEDAKDWVIVPGKPDDSELIRRILSEEEYEVMPPADAKQQLTDEEKELIRRWVAEGADWTQHWSYLAPERPDVPVVKDSSWPQNAIDHFILQRLEGESLLPSPRATKEKLIRRVTFDLTGLPPTLEEIDSFLSDDTVDAYEKVVDRLLASTRYGEHMALAWLSAARYADSNGYQHDATRTMWPWRDWVIRAMNDNMPYDQFTVEQLAGDLLENPTQEQLLATGFNRNHMLNGEGGRIAEESRVEYVVDRAATTGTVWLGMTMECARCHDHKYDPLPQKEFFKFYAHFNNVDETGGVDEKGNARPLLRMPTAEEQEEVERIEASIAAVERRLEAIPQPSSDEMRAWEDETKKWLELQRADKKWTMPSEQQADTKAGSHLAIQSDHSVLVTDLADDNEEYIVTITLPPGTYYGLRLEAMKDDRLFDGLYSYASSGDFFLTDLHVEFEGASVQVADAETNVKSGKTAGHVLDGSDITGWRVGNPKENHQPPQWTGRFTQPVAAGLESTHSDSKLADSNLKVYLRHRASEYSVPIGRFRLSLTTYPQPTLAENLGFSEDELAALEVAPEQRTDEQQQLLATTYFALLKQPYLDEIASLKSQKSQLEKTFLTTMIMEEREERRPTYLLVRGVFDDPDKSELLEPDVPECLPELPPDAPRDRLTLARWLVDPANPLTARVTVNRYWQDFFGIGLVKTSEDFGSQGERPSHPELLDWLAVEFVESGWDVKHMQKLMVMSASYQQSAEFTADLAQIDPENRLLARGPRFRLSAQALRDQALALSGLLVEQFGGPPVKPYQPEGVWEDFSLGLISYDQGTGEDLYRRSIYTFWRRSVGPTSLFDSSARQICSVKPSRTNSPLHALTLLNDVTYVEAARVLAEKLIVQDEMTAQERIERMFRMATSRYPSEAELENLTDSLDRLREIFVANREEAEKLRTAGEAPIDKEADAVEVAAYTSLINAILNLDEVLTKG